MIHPPDVRSIPLYERGIPSAFRQWVMIEIETAVIEYVVKIMVEGSGTGRPRGLNEILTKA